MTFDVKTIRNQFPIFERKINGKPLAYLDNAATTQKPQCVLDAVDTYYTSMNANIHRAIHTLGEEATEAYEKARVTVAGFINAYDSREVVFVRNTTEAINLVAYTWAQQNIRAGDEIVITEMEHHSNIIPWQLLAERVGALLRFAKITPDGELCLTNFASLLNEKTKLVSVVHGSNVLGTVNPVKKITEMAHKVGAKVLIDGAQSVPHLAVDVQDIGCDFFAFSGHKMYAPMGVGVLWARKELLEEMPPFLGGGEMIREVTIKGSTWNDIPYKFEAGTPYVSGALGLAEAIRFIQSIGITTIRDHETVLTNYARELLEQNDHITIYGPKERGAVLAFTHDAIHPHDLSAILDAEEGVATRSGHHCAMPLSRRLDVSSTCRASFAVYTIKEEIDALIRGIGKAETLFL